MIPGTLLPVHPDRLVVTLKSLFIWGFADSWRNSRCTRHGARDGWLRSSSHGRSRSCEHRHGHDCGEHQQGCAKSHSHGKTTFLSARHFWLKCRCTLPDQICSRSFRVRADHLFPPRGRYPRPPLVELFQLTGRESTSDDRQRSRQAATAKFLGIGSVHSGALGIDARDHHRGDAPLIGAHLNGHGSRVASDADDPVRVGTAPCRHQ